MHKLLAEQLKHIYGQNIPDSPEFREFVRVINDSYELNENNRFLLEKNTPISSDSSDEHSKVNNKLKASSLNKRELIDNLLNAIARLAQSENELELINLLSEPESSLHLIELVNQLRVLAEEQKQIQQHSHLQDARMTEAQTLANFGTWTYDLNLEKSECSDNLSQLLNSNDLNNLSREKYLSLVYSEDKTELELELKDVLERDIQIFTHRILHDDGNLKWIEASIKVFRDEYGKPTQLLGTALDITRLKVAETALENKILELEDTSDFLDTVIEQMPVSIYVKDAKTRRYLKANKVGLEIIGKKPDEFIGFTYDDIFEPQLANTFRAQDDIVVQSRAISLQDDELFKMENGQEFIFRILNVPIFDQTEEIKYILTISMDITESKRVEEQIKNAAKTAQEANRAKSAFLSSMSHELRTPLNAIIGFSQILQRDKALPAVQKSYVETMYRSGNHLLAMINDVLDISKIESGKFELVFETFTIKEIANDLEALFNLRAAEKGLTLSITYQENNPLAFYSDNKRIQQVLINLLGNSIKFTSRGEISVNISSQSIPESSSCLLEFIIKDTGRGIPENQLKTIFEPFQQVKGFFSDGTGLGLAISAKITEMLSGELLVDSKLGVGSTFHFRVPVDIVQNAVNENNNEFIQVHEIAGDKSWRILIVDDIANNRSVVRTFLESIGFECIEANDGFDAVKMAEIFFPDVIFMDIMMPRMNGIEAFKKIRNNPQLEKTKIIALTASGSVTTKKELLELGFDDYITKPYHEHWLIQSLEKVANIEFVKSTQETVAKPDTNKDFLSEAYNWYKMQDGLLCEQLLEAIELQAFDAISDAIKPFTNQSAIANYILKQAKAENHLFFISLQDRITQS